MGEGRGRWKKIRNIRREAISVTLNFSLLVAAFPKGSSTWKYISGPHLFLSYVIFVLLTAAT
jgi:hypothetical protein